MSWGEVWVSAGNERPEFDPSRPAAPWVKAGVITREERDFIDAMKKMRGTRKGQPRTVDFFLQVRTRDVVRDRADAAKGALAFDPAGLWLAVDVTGPGADRPSFVFTTQRVHSISVKRMPAPPTGGQRPVAVLPLRAKSVGLGLSPLEWARTADSDD